MKPHELRRWASTTRGLIAIAIAAMAAIALVAWMVREGPAEGPLPVDVTRAVVPALPSPSESPPTQQVAPPPAVVVAARNDQVQVCGGEWIDAGADGTVAEADLESLRRRVVTRTMAPTLALLLGSADERARAAGQVLLAGDTELIGSVCKGDKDCVSRERQRHRAALVGLARSTADAQVYAWAYQACLGAQPEDPGGCHQISVEQWARLDPGNATPWMHAADLAKQRGDAGGLDEALFHVASADRQDSGWGRLAATILEHVPDGEEHLIGALMLATSAIGIDAAMLSPYLSVTEYCSVGALADANRHETCARIADVLADRSSTLMDQGIGRSLGRRLGWPSARLQALQDERDAIAETGIHRAAARSKAEPRDCKAIVAEFDWMRQVAAEGELGAGRSAIAASGKSTEVLAAEWRASMAIAARLPAASAAASDAQIAVATRSPER